MASSKRSYDEMVGQSYGSWTVAEIIRVDGSQTQCRVVCECGTSKILFACSIRSGDSTSCGCKRRQIKQQRSYDRHKHLIGMRFGRLVVMDVIVGNNARLKCVCDCGSITRPYASPHATGPKSQSCGCDHSAAIKAARTHGRSKTPTYNSWQAMMHRCLNPKRQNYVDYGGRGITVCDGLRSYEHFEATVGERPQGKTIDRIDNESGYFCGTCEQCSLLCRKTNVRWATLKEQVANARPRRKRSPRPRKTMTAK